MLLLDTTSRKLQVTTSAATNVDAVAAWVDLTASAYAPGVTPTAISTATTTDVVAAPGSSTTRQIKTLSVRNKSTSTANTVSVIIDDSGTDYVLHVALLGPGDTLSYTDADGWRVHDSAGRPRMSTAESSPIDGYSRNILKVGAAAEAIGILHTSALSTGTPGAWAPGTPGAAGRATDGTAAGDAGCIPLQTPAAGSNWLVGYTASGTVAHAHVLLDILWVQSGLTLTTTTAQTINSVAFPSRDDNGATSGAGVQIGIFSAAATGNAGAITNTTVNYTNSGGTGSRTGTMASFPATAAAGTIVPFQLAAGDVGVQSIQDVTLGTSYVSGTVHLIAYRVIAMAPAVSANVGVPATLGRGVKLWPGSCLILAYIPSAVTATTVTAVANIEVR